MPDLSAENAADELARIIDETAAQHDGRVPDLLVVDTLAAATPGADENDSGAVGAALHALRATRRRFACATLVIHHVRKPSAAAAKRGSDGESTMHALRGSSALAGAADVVLIADGSSVTIAKSRDGARGEPLRYEITAQATGRLGESGAVVLPASERFGPPLPSAEDEAAAAAAAKAIRDREQSLRDAATVATTLADRPGLVVRELVAAVRAAAGTMAQGRIDVAMARLEAARVIHHGARGARLHYLAGDRLPLEVVDRLPLEDRDRIRDTRPPEIPSPPPSQETKE